MTQLLLWILWERRNLKISHTTQYRKSLFPRQHEVCHNVERYFGGKQKTHVKKMLRFRVPNQTRCAFKQYDDVCPKKFNEVSQWSHPTRKKSSHPFPTICQPFSPWKRRFLPPFFSTKPLVLGSEKHGWHSHRNSRDFEGVLVDPVGVFFVGTWGPHLVPYLDVPGS